MKTSAVSPTSLPIIAHPIHQLCQNPKKPAALGGLGPLRKVLKEKVSPTELRSLIKYFDPYTVHKPAKHRSLRNRVLVWNLRKPFQSDRVDPRLQHAENDGYKYLLTAINCSFRLAHAVPLREKTVRSVIEGLIKTLGRLASPAKLQVDKGTEFHSSAVKAFLKDNGIPLFSSENENVRCATPERSYGTLKNKIFRHFRTRLGVRYVADLDDLLKGYNNSRHAATKTALARISERNYPKVFETVIRLPFARTPRLNVGNHVRISKSESVLARGNIARFEEKTYTT